jgi:hypothetical protein
MLKQVFSVCLVFKSQTDKLGITYRNVHSFMGGYVLLSAAVDVEIK